MINAVKAARNIFFSTLFVSTALVSVNAAETTDDPIVAVVNGVGLNKSDLEIIHQNLQEPWSQYDFDSLFPTLQDLAIRLQLAKQDGLGKKLEESEEYTKNVEFTSANILQDLALKAYIQENLTEENLKIYYEDKIKDFTPEEERKTRHILVETPEKAEEIIKRLDAGEDFNTLAIEASIGPSGANGGELGWASKNEFVPEFADAAWAIEKGTYGKAPVQTSFGYHVILVEDIRKTEVPQFEDVKALLEGELQRDLEEQYFEELQRNADITRYDVNGEVMVMPEAPDEVEPVEGEVDAATMEETASDEVIAEQMVEEAVAAEEIAEAVEEETQAVEAAEIVEQAEAIAAEGAAEVIEATEEAAEEAAQIKEQVVESLSNAIEAGDAAITKTQ